MFKMTQTGLHFTLGQLFMLIEANSDTSTVGPSNKDHPFCQMKEQVVLKFYVFYNVKLFFGIFHSGSLVL